MWGLRPSLPEFRSWELRGRPHSGHSPKVRRIREIVARCQLHGAQSWTPRHGNTSTISIDPDQPIAEI